MKRKASHVIQRFRGDVRRGRAMALAGLAPLGLMTA
jgi:hypothetical protein